MQRKETTTSEDLLAIIQLLEEAGITYWIDGGWGVDLLVGRQTRDHRDIDVDYDAARTSELLEILTHSGYTVDVDWSPVRMELYSDRYGYLDIHPFILHKNGSAKQADLDGGWYEFGSSCFGFAHFSGRNVPCISLEGQKIFHTGYDLRDKDLHDLAVLAEITVRKYCPLDCG